MAILRFQCSECGLGDREIGHLMDEGDLLRRLPGRAAPQNPRPLLGRTRSGSLAPTLGSRLRRLRGVFGCFGLATLDRQLESGLPAHIVG
jgi:hypothetical protein